MLEYEIDSRKTLAQKRKKMYRDHRGQLEFVDFYLPFGGKMRKDNRWVRMAEIMPWDEITELYKESLAGTGMGTPALNARVAFGALVIKKLMGLTDEETVLYIQENPYAQYYLGYHEYQEERLFDASMMTHFRKRFTMEVVKRINERLVKQAWSKSEGEEGCENHRIEETGSRNEGTDDAVENSRATRSERSEGEEAAKELSEEAETARAGKLLIDATCCPADIAYPTYVGLMSKARRRTEALIDRLYEQARGAMKKPRTYRRIARKHFAAFSRSRKPRKKAIRKALRRQLGYVKRNLNHITTLAQEVSVARLTRREYREFLIIQELYRQQREMYEQRRHSITGRIVSVDQPHVRPIKRGKAAADTEFGAKISVGMIEGYAFVDKLAWDNYNESGDLQKQVERYRERTGAYPESVHADKIYRTRENRRYLRELKIRLSGAPLGRPRKEHTGNTPEALAHKKQMREDERARIPIEGKFGQCKRRFSLNRVMTKLQGTSETSIAMTILTVNLLKALADSFSAFLRFAMFQTLTPYSPLLGCSVASWTFSGSPK